MNEKYVELFNKTKSIDNKYEILKYALHDGDRETLLYLIDPFRNTVVKSMSDKPSQKYLDMYRESFLMTSHYRFEDFMIYLEINRPKSEQFYRPRMKALKPIAEALQELYESDLDELFISQPPRTGKSTIITFFVAWVMGLNSEGTNLYSSCTDTNTNSFYRGVLEVLEDDVTYTFKEIFPDYRIAQQDSKKNTIDLGRRKKYPTLTCRSIGGTLNGSCDCNSLLIADDLVTGIEDVLNPDRLFRLWQLTDNNLLTRAKGTAKKIWIGTRWSVNDPIGIRLDLLQNDEMFKGYKFRVINIPALNDDDESNFEYDYDVGFSTEQYQQRRASFERNDDMASWSAQYMGEPIEREGTLFTSSNMRYFNGILPDNPNRITCSVDVAWGGGDFVSAPVAYIYDNGDVYIPDVVFNKGDKYVTRPMVARLIERNHCGDADFELNNGGSEYQEKVEELLGERNYKCTLTGHTAPSQKGKDVRIFQNAPEIREWYFLEQGRRSKEYSQFMSNLFSYKVLGKNKNDDAPDSLAQLADNIRGHRFSQVRIFNRPF